MTGVSREISHCHLICHISDHFFTLKQVSQTHRLAAVAYYLSLFLLHDNSFVLSIACTNYLRPKCVPNEDVHKKPCCRFCPPRSRLGACGQAERQECRDATQGGGRADRPARPPSFLHSAGRRGRRTASSPRAQFFCRCFVLCAHALCFILMLCAPSFVLMLCDYQVFWSPLAKHEARSRQNAHGADDQRQQADAPAHKNRVFLSHMAKHKAQSMSTKQPILTKICDFEHKARSTKH
jgi:hypothetical protein